MNEILHTWGCSEKYAELCALSTSGDLSSDETAELHQHLASCPRCAALHDEYLSLAHIGMAKLAAELGQEDERLYPFRQWAAERRLVETLEQAPAETQISSLEREGADTDRHRSGAGRRFAVGLGLAAAFLLAIGGGVVIGRRLENRLGKSQTVALPSPSMSLSKHEKEELQAQLDLVEKSLTAVQSRASEDAKRIGDLTNSRVALLAQIDQLTKSGQAASDSLASVTHERDGFQQQLKETNQTLDQVKADLVEARLDRQGAVLKAANFEQEINTLHATLASADRTVSGDEQFLAKDRDIRELMGARQLYIADVLDVQHDGRPSKPFGRVFYTKGKSLIFYAFDLQSQPGYREAKTFQAWGRPDVGSSKPLSLGIFYMDSEQNKRWVVKSANPDVLARINAVFVTVEPKGGSQEPTSKPFLEAYLHSLPPNHP